MEKTKNNARKNNTALQVISFAELCFTLFVIKEKERTNHIKRIVRSFFGGDGEIRTHVPVRANAFRVRPVMTASIRLRVELFGTLIANCKAGSNFTALKVREKCRKCEENEGKTRFRETPRDETEMISSQPRYDHFDISPYSIVFEFCTAFARPMIKCIHPKFKKNEAFAR